MNAPQGGLLVLGQNKAGYTVEYSADGGTTLRFQFSIAQITDGAFHHLQSMNLFNTEHRTSFTLNTKQQNAFSEVLQKLMTEQHSDYTFSSQLQTTYLLELIHLITKVYHSNLPVFE